MLYWLIHANLPALERTPFGFLRVFTFNEFQALVATLLAFGICLALGGPTIQWLRRQKIGDAADFDDATFNETMKSKVGTPTMGGLLIVSAIAGVTLLLADLRNFYVLMGLVCLLWMGLVGATDDWLKLTAARRKTGRQGLSSREKLLFQVGLALLLGYFAFRHGHAVPAATTLYFPFFKGLSVPLPLWAFLVLAVLVIVGSSNAVNLTDGLDGLAAGCMAIVGLVFLVLTLIISDATLATYLLFDPIRQVGQMSVFCGAIVGACLGFLWFNCHPARVFMGDTGSLALGRPDRLRRPGDPSGAGAGPRRRNLRGRGAERDAASGLLQIHAAAVRCRAAHLPDVAAAPPLPEKGLERDAGRGAVLAGGRDARGADAGDGEAAVIRRSAAGRAITTHSQHQDSDTR